MKFHTGIVAGFDESGNFTPLNSGDPTLLRLKEVLFELVSLLEQEPASKLVVKKNASFVAYEEIPVMFNEVMLDDTSIAYTLYDNTYYFLVSRKDFGTILISFKQYGNSIDILNFVDDTTIDLSNLAFPLNYLQTIKLINLLDLSSVETTQYSTLYQEFSIKKFNFPNDFISEGLVIKFF